MRSAIKLGPDGQRHRRRLPRPQVHRDDRHDRAADPRRYPHDQRCRRRWPIRTRRCCPACSSTPQVVLPAEADQVVLPETAVDYTLYGDSVYVIRQDGADAAGKPVLKAFRTSVKTGAALGQARWRSCRAEARRRGRRCRPGQGAGRRRGHGHRQSAAAAAGPTQPSVTPLSIRLADALSCGRARIAIEPDDGSHVHAFHRHLHPPARCWRWSSAC